MRTVIDEQLTAAGWKRTPGGRWTHTAFPGPNGRRRVFTTGAAYVLLDADPQHKDPRTPAEQVQDAVDEAIRFDAERVQHTCDESVIP